VAASLAGAIGVSLWGVESAEAVLCKVGGGSPTHGTIDSAVDDSSCTKVKVANGTYVEYVTITRSVALSGNGPGTVIQAPGGGTIVAVSGSGVNASIERFTIRGPVPEGTTTLMGVVVDGGAEAEIRNNTISDIREDTFSGIGSNDNFDAVMVGAVSSVGTALIKGNRIQRYQKSGIVVDGIGSSAEITQNTIFGSPRLLATQPAPYGVQVSRGATAEVRANRVTDNSNLASVVQSVGILLFEAGDGVRVVNNTVSGNDTGICVKQTDNAVIERNRVSDSAFDGISLDNQNPAMTTENNTVSRNTVLRNGEGITLFSANNNAIDRNTSSNNNGAGFWVSCDDAGGGCTQVESFGNTFTENTANRNLIGYQDESSGGGTSGTANTYTDNKCAFNGEGSDPDGLCLPQQP
jgi:parallel beta-helix repeat protein